MPVWQLLDLKRQFQSQSKGIPNHMPSHGRAPHIFLVQDQAYPMRSCAWAAAGSTHRISSHSLSAPMLYPLLCPAGHQETTGFCIRMPSAISHSYLQTVEYRQKIEDNKLTI